MKSGCKQLQKTLDLEKFSDKLELQIKPIVKGLLRTIPELKS